MMNGGGHHSGDHYVDNANKNNAKNVRMISSTTTIINNGKLASYADKCKAKQIVNHWACE
jgi:hypothetical protein